MNTNFEINSDNAIIKINKNIYPKEIIIQTTYVMLDRFYFLIDEDENYFLVLMRFKEKENINFETAIYEFFDELIESQAYINQLKRTSKIREIILEKALLSQVSQVSQNEFIEELEQDNINL